MKRQRSVLTALVAGAALLLTACGSSSDGGTTSASTQATGNAPAASDESSSGDSTDSPDATAGETSEGDSGSVEATSGIVTVNSTEPQNPLIPTNTNEVGGGRVIDSIFSKLVYYDAKGEPQLEAAESIETDDSQTYTIKLKADQKFTNGDPVDSASFVDAWNYGANATNAQLSSYFFESIEGYADVNFCEEGAGPPDEEGNATCLPAPKAETMSGLTVVDDTTFTVKLSQPESDFPLRLGYSAFAPLPKVAFEDIEAFGQSPIGNGPYMLASPDAWQHNVQIDTIPNPDYTGGRTPKNGGITFRIYDALEAAYADLISDNLDVLDQFPSSALTTYETDLPDRYVNQPGAVIQTICIPARNEHFAVGEEGNLRRQAISMAINRPEITEVILSNTRTPASDFTSPVIGGWSDSLTGKEVLDFNEAKAKELWAQADAISPWSGTFTISYNSDGPHKEWVDAVANSIKNTLGIEAAGNPYATFAEVRADVTGRTIQGAFRTGWQGDYPSELNFLGPLYKTGAGSNDGDYSNPDFDKLLDEGAAASSVEEGIEKFTQAQEILLKDLPVIPLWYQNTAGGWATTVQNVQFGWDSQPLYYEITKA